MTRGTPTRVAVLLHVYFAISFGSSVEKNKELPSTAMAEDDICAVNAESCSLQFLQTAKIEKRPDFQEGEFHATEEQARHEDTLGESHQVLSSSQEELDDSVEEQEELDDSVEEQEELDDSVEEQEELDDSVEESLEKPTRVRRGSKRGSKRARPEARPEGAKPSKAGGDVPVDHGR